MCAVIRQEKEQNSGASVEALADMDQVTEIPNVKIILKGNNEDVTIN